MEMLNGTTKFLPKSQIEAALSAVPMKMTDPRLSRRVSVAGPVGYDIFRRRFHIIFYYNKLSSKDLGRSVAGWSKESLARALVEQPMLAGRLRRGGEGSGGELEIVSNDSGIRLFEARISKTLAEFLDLEEREDAEAELVFWKDVDEQNPQFSPLFYVQVTNFQCGGYSVGISCSLLLADPLAIICFIRTWANKHSKMVSGSEMTELPIFYLPHLKPNASSLHNQTGSKGIKNCGKPLIFKTAATKLNLDDVETRTALAELCIEEAEVKLGAKRASKFSLLVKASSEEIEVESYLREGLLEKPINCGSGLTFVSWDDLGANEVSFYEGSKPVCVPYWINSAPGEGHVILISSLDESVSDETRIVVTIA